MDLIALRAFRDELELIYGVEKDAGVREALQRGMLVVHKASKAIGKGNEAANKLALKGIVRVNAMPGGHHIVHALASTDAQSLGHSLSRLG